MAPFPKNGWRTTKREPGDDSIAQEKPQLVLKMIESTYGTSTDVAQMRRDFGIPMSMLRSLLQAHSAGGHSSNGSVLTMVPR